MYCLQIRIPPIQITRDIRFLRSQGLMDYSLLIGVQPKHHDRQGPQNLAELVSSIKRWLIDHEFKNAIQNLSQMIFNCRSSLGFIEDSRSRPTATWGTKTFTEELDDEVSIRNNSVLFQICILNMHLPLFFNFQLPHMIPMRGPPAEPPAAPASRLSYINDILCDEEICEVIREEERSKVARNSAKPHQNNTVHVRQVRFGGGNGRVSSSGSLGLRRHFATANPSLLSRDQLTSPTPSVHFQVHPAPRSSPKKRYVHSNVKQCLPYLTGLIGMKH